MSDTVVEQHIDETVEQPFINRLPRLLVIAGISLVLLAGIIKVYNIARLGQSLLSYQDKATALMDGGLTNADPEQAEALVLAARQDIVDLKAETRPFVAIAPFFGWMPKVGSVFANAAELMEIADAGSEAGVYAVQGLSPALTIMQTENTTGQSRIPQLLTVIDEAEVDLFRASQAIDRLAEARADMTKVESLPGPLASLIQRLDADLPMAQDLIQMSLVAPEIMGIEGRRTYLIIAQNEDEMRPTGGFISGAGLLIVENGQIVSIAFSDANIIDAFDQPGKPYDLPPQPFTDYMGMDIFLFRDTNFWPDFPVSAEKAMELYTYGQDVPVDGAIAINQQFVRLLLSGIGPVDVAELGIRVNADNVIEQMRAEWGPGNDPSIIWVDDRKAFMGPLASAIQTKLEVSMASLDLVTLLRQIQAAADQRHMQIYMRDPQVASVLAEIGWDGNQANVAGNDYLLVVDSNFGFNKVSAAIELETTYDVVLTEGNGGQETAGGQATVTLAYSHVFPAVSNQESCSHGSDYFEGIRYEDLINDCYWNYIRLYTPSGSKLIQSTSHPLAANFFLSGRPWDGEAQVVADEPTPLAVFANFLLIPQGQTVTTNFTYQLPASIIEQDNGKSHYILEVHKQAGVRSQPITITVTLPPGTNLEKTIPAATSVEGQVITYSTALQQDLIIEVIYD